MKSFWKNIRLTEVLTFLLFVVLAAFIWYGHAMHSVRTTRVPVLMQYTNKPGAIGLGEKLPDTVMIEVRDAGQQLNIYHSEPLHLTINLRRYIQGEKGTIHVPSDVLRRSISDLLQSSSSLIDTWPEEITCTYFTEQEKNVHVATRCELALADEYQLVGKPELSRTRVKIYGQDKTLSTIDTLFTEAIELEDVSDTVQMRVALALPQGVRAEVDSVDLRIITERFTEKKFIVPLQVSGVPEGVHIHLFPHEVEVSVRVGLSHFAQVMPEDISAKCHYSPEQKEKLDVELHYSNPFITDAWAYPGVVEFLIE